MAMHEEPGHSPDVSPDAGERARRPVTYLHIGAPKSGTSYLQSALWDNRDALRADGVLYPGEQYLSHTHAVLDLQGQRFFGYEDPAIPGAWQRMVAGVRAWNGTAIISQELLSPARPEAIERALEALDFCEVHLVYTARDLARQVPAVWQENLKNRYDLTFGEFATALRAPQEEMHTLAVGFWRMQDAAGVLSRWSRGIPPERVHLITIPPPDAPRDVLWARFCAVTGLDAGRYALPGAAVNVSLGVAEANLLRRLNLALGDDVRWPVYDECVKGFLGADVLAGRPGRRAISLPGGERPWLTERSRQLVDELRKEDYDVAGDLDELLPAAPPGSAGTTSPDDPADREMLDAAVRSMAALLGRLQGRRDDLDRLTAERDGLRTELTAVRADRDRLHEETGRLREEGDRLREEGDRLREVLAKPAAKLFVRRLSERHRAVMRVRIIYWNIVQAGRRLRRGRHGGDRDVR
jgi:hypothetical protein